MQHHSRLAEYMHRNNLNEFTQSPKDLQGTDAHNSVHPSTSCSGLGIHISRATFLAIIQQMGYTRLLAAGQMRRAVGRNQDLAEMCAWSWAEHLA